MARPTRCRQICGFPDHWSFSADDISESKGWTAPAITLSLDEYETIRLIDHEQLTQEQCAKQMDIARTTVTAIYDQARRKIAAALVEGRQLVIRGGHYRLQPSAVNLPENLSTKGEKAMRIAVTYENGEIFQHFGHTQEFKVYDVEDGQITNAEVIGTGGTGHGALAGLLHEVHTDALICGGIGGGARMALAEAGIELYPGVTGPADDAAKALAEGTLVYDPDTECAHHGEGHGGNCHGHGGGHSCGHGEGPSCGHGGGNCHR